MHLLFSFLRVFLLILYAFFRLLPKKIEENYSDKFHRDAIDSVFSDELTLYITSVGIFILLYVRCRNFFTIEDLRLMNSYGMLHHSFVRCYELQLFPKIMKWNNVYTIWRRFTWQHPLTGPIILKSIFLI